MEKTHKQKIDLSSGDKKKKIKDSSADKELLASSSTNEECPNEGMKIKYVAIKNVKQKKYYDFFDSTGNTLYSSMIRLHNESYSPSMEFDFYMDGKCLYYITKDKQSKLFECEKATPLNSDLIAFKLQGVPYWGIADKSGNIILKNNRLGQIFGITSEMIVFCLTALDKAGLFDINNPQDKYAVMPYNKSKWKVLMHPETQVVCVNSHLFFPEIEYSTFSNMEIKQILSRNYLVAKREYYNEFQLFRFPEDNCLCSFVNNLSSDSNFFWDAKRRESYNINKQTYMNFRPLVNKGTFYLVDGGYGMSLYDANDVIPLVEGKKRICFIDSKHVAFQNEDYSLCIYNYVEKNQQRFETDYELYTALIINRVLWVVTLHNKKDYCCYLFSLDGGDIIADRLAQYHFFAPFNNRSILYAKDQSLYTIEFDSKNDTQVEKLLCKYNHKFPKDTVILPKGAKHFVILNNEVWDLIDSSGKCIIERNKEYEVLEKDDMESFVNSDILIVRKKNDKNKGANLSSGAFGAYNLEGKMIIPCEYDKIECW